MTVTCLAMEGGCWHPSFVTHLLQVQPADGGEQGRLQAGTKTGSQPPPNSYGIRALSLRPGQGVPQEQGGNSFRSGKAPGSEAETSGLLGNILEIKVRRKL